MNTRYEAWLQEEKNWINEYCKRTKKTTLTRTVPAVILVMPLVFGVLGFIGGGDAWAALESAVGGVVLAILSLILHLIFIMIGLNPERFVKKIRKNVNKLGLSDSDMEQLGAEILEAYEKNEKVVSFDITNPGNSNRLPARFVLTPHYCFLAGSSPYSVLVRLSDIDLIKTSEERKQTTKRGAKIKTTYFYTLYCIGFYRRDRKEKGKKGEYPDIAMGFLEPEIRQKVLYLLSETQIPMG